MTPKELRKISEDYYKEDLNSYFVESVTKAAKMGQTSIILDNDLRTYSKSGSYNTLLESLLQLGYKVSYRGIPDLVKMSIQFSLGTHQNDNKTIL